MNKGKGKRLCDKGKPCGATCIERRKICQKEARDSVGQGLSTVAGEVNKRSKKGTVKEQIARLESARAQKVDEVYAFLSKDRGDGQGTHFENPNEKTFRVLANLSRKTEAIDALLNKLEGRPMEIRIGADGKPFEHQPKRWYPDRFNLEEKFTKFKTEAREKYIESMVQQFLDKGAKGDPPQAIYMMGGPGSGKTTLLAKMMEGKSGFVHIDPDAIKALLPEYQFGVAMGFKGIANTVNASSGTIASKLGRKARSAKLNYIWDGTGASLNHYQEQIKELRKKGYNIEIIAQHVPAREGIQRAIARSGLPISMGGGRFVPIEAIENAYKNVPRNFEPLAKLVDSASITDGLSGREIMRYDGGKVSSEDAPAAKDFRDRYGEEG
jgi:predicted ABC-type ATPase